MIASEESKTKTYGYKNKKKRLIEYKEEEKNQR